MSRSASSRCRRGTVTVEFALIAGIFFVAMFACIELGRFVGTRTALRAAVGEVVRAAQANEALNGCEAPKTLALGRTQLLNAANFNICVTRPASQLTVTVTADYTFTFIISAFGTAPRTLRATVTSPV